MNVLFVRSITSHLSPTSPIVVNSVNPGFCHSNLRRDVPLPLKPLVWLFEQSFARETSEGAKTYIWAALAGSNDAFVRDSLRGSYTSDCRIAEPSDYVLSQDGQNVQKRIWVCAFLLQSGGIV
jgi:retinol dehydrogenase-12